MALDPDVDYLRKQDRDRAFARAIAQMAEARPARSRTSRTRPARDRISLLRETQPERSMNILTNAIDALKEPWRGGAGEHPPCTSEELHLSGVDHQL